MECWDPAHKAGHFWILHPVLSRDIDEHGVIQVVKIEKVDSVY